VEERGLVVCMGAACLTRGLIGWQGRCLHAGACVFYSSSRPCHVSAFDATTPSFRVVLKGRCQHTGGGSFRPWRLRDCHATGGGESDSLNL